MILLLQSVHDYNDDLRTMIMAFFPGVKIVEDIEKADVIDFIFHAEYSEDNTRLWLSSFSDSEENSDNVLFTPAGKELSVCVEGRYIDKNTFKNKHKKAVYHLLCDYTGRMLPWGDMTGVRPTKIAMSLLEQGLDFDAAVKNYIDVYEVSRKKAVLATSVAANELSLTKGIDLNNSYSLYVGIPFCPSRCLYCSFTSYPIARYEKVASVYVDKLIEELSETARAHKDSRLVSIYMGGGTPTAISHELLDKLLAHINKVFELDSHADDLLEFTVEAGRPDSITKEKLEVLKKHGVTRISINPQTMNDETLRTIGRAHTSNQTKEAFALARSYGFDNINMDLIAGLPGENVSNMAYTLEQIEAMKPDSITIHSLAIKRAANLRQQLDEYGGMINKDMDEMHDMAAELGNRLGMKPYYLYRQKNIGGNLENVGYAKPGCECIYNILIMEELHTIVACGAGTITKRVYGNGRIERCDNVKDVELYIDKLDEMLDRKRKLFDD